MTDLGFRETVASPSHTSINAEQLSSEPKSDCTSKARVEVIMLDVVLDNPLS